MPILPTPQRIRLTLVIYAGVLAAAAFGGGQAFAGGAGLAAQAIGFALVVLAVLGRLWTSFFIAGRKDVELVREGPYARCRHPLYAASILAALGIGLSTRSLTLIIALPPLIGAIVAVAARGEEAFMRNRHGAAYDAYREAVPGFALYGLGRALPDRIAANPEVYRKAFFDAASFLGLWLAIVLLDGLRAGGAWAAMFRLP